MYISRHLEYHVANLLPHVPVLIIEGARSVGKTSLLTTLHQQGLITTHVSLVDPQHRAAATENPAAWLNSLPQPLAIDEAQLAPELPLAIKHYLDSHNDQAQIILTGSAAIGRTGLGGTDPLARRCVRLTLEPLTASELAGHPPWSVADALFHHVPHSAAPSSAPPWTSWVPLGGLPRYCLSSAPTETITGNVHRDIAAVLTDDVLPGERFDRRIAQDVAEYLLRNPAGEVNVAVAARTVGIDPRSANRYLDVLARRFITCELPNVKRSAKRSSRASAKHYPTDVALSYATLLRSGASLDDDVVRGGLLEAWVVQQLRAHSSWSQNEFVLNHYRDSSSGRTVEVDIVLVEPGGGLVGIEVKATNRATSKHCGGLRALKAAYPQRWRRGFVVTTGATCAALAEDVWALPLAGFVDPRWWPTVQQECVAQEGFVAGGDAVPVGLVGSGALSLVVQVHPSERDAAYLGAPAVFAQDVAELLTAVHGAPTTVSATVSTTGTHLALRFVTPRSGAHWSLVGDETPASHIIRVGWLTAAGEDQAHDCDVAAFSARTAQRNSPEYARALDDTAAAVLRVLRT